MSIDKVSEPAGVQKASKTQPAKFVLFYHNKRQRRMMSQTKCLQRKNLSVEIIRLQKT
jgi:hypothetical protein